MEFRVVVMAVVVAARLEFQFFIERSLKVYPGLVGKAQYYEYHIGQLFAQVFCLVGFFFALLAVTPRYDTRHFAYLFGKLCHVGQFVEISYAVFFYPGIDGQL